MPDTIISPFERTFQQPIETYRSVGTVSQRDAIPTGVRWEGMQVYVSTEQKTFELRGGLGNQDWIDTSAEVTVLVEDVLTSTNITNALSANQGRVLNEKFNDYVPKTGGTFTGVVTAQNFVSSSDMRLKENINTAEAQTMRVNYTTWHWRKDKHKRVNIGVIAQSIEHEHPELVVEDPETGLKAVDYTQLLIWEVLALKEELAEVKERLRRYARTD